MTAEGNDPPASDLSRRYFTFRKRKVFTTEAGQRTYTQFVFHPVCLWSDFLSFVFSSFGLISKLFYSLLFPCVAILLSAVWGKVPLSPASRVINGWQMYQTNMDPMVAMGTTSAAPETGGREGKRTREEEEEEEKKWSVK